MKSIPFWTPEHNETGPRRKAHVQHVSLRFVTLSSQESDKRPIFSVFFGDWAARPARGVRGAERHGTFFSLWSPAALLSEIGNPLSWTRFLLRADGTALDPSRARMGFGEFWSIPRARLIQTHFSCFCTTDKIWLNDLIFFLNQTALIKNILEYLCDIFTPTPPPLSFICIDYIIYMLIILHKCKYR